MIFSLSGVGSAGVLALDVDALMAKTSLGALADQGFPVGGESTH